MPRRRLQQGDRPKPTLVQRLEERREQYERRGIAYRAAWVTAGVIVTLAGLAMLALPGPAFVVIPIGLAMLSLQFAWAAHLLERALEQAEVAKEKAANTSTRQRVATTAAGLCAAAAVVAAIIVFEIDVPLVPWF
jgi:uncharacterized protein (TIGR02611 family)